MNFMLIPGGLVSTHMIDYLQSVILKYLAGFSMATVTPRCCKSAPKREKPLAVLAGFVLKCLHIPYSLDHSVSLGYGHKLPLADVPTNMLVSSQPPPIHFTAFPLPSLLSSFYLLCNIFVTISMNSTTRPLLSISHLPSVSILLSFLSLTMLSCDCSSISKPCRVLLKSVISVLEV